MCGATQGGLSVQGIDVTKEAVIQGRVLRSGEPVSNAYVRLLDSTGEFTAEVPTSATGHFRFFAGDGPGPYARWPRVRRPIARWSPPAATCSRWTSSSTPSLPPESVLSILLGRPGSGCEQVLVAERGAVPLRWTAPHWRSGAPQSGGAGLLSRHPAAG